MKILIKEENILYNLVEYLQDVGFLKTDKKNPPRITTTDDESTD
jgi:hypothetical protein